MIHAHSDNFGGFVWRIAERDLSYDCVAVFVFVSAKTHTLSQSVTESPIIPTEPARQPISQKETAYSSLIGSQINTNSPPSNQILDSLTLSLDDVIPS